MGFTGKHCCSCSESTLMMGNTNSEGGGAGSSLGKHCIHHSQDRLGLHISFCHAIYFLSCGPFTGAVFSEQSFFGRLSVRSKPMLPESQCYSPTQEVAQLSVQTLNKLKFTVLYEIHEWEGQVGRVISVLWSLTMTSIQMVESQAIFSSLLSSTPTQLLRRSLLGRCGVSILINPKCLDSLDRFMALMSGWPQCSFIPAKQIPFRQEFS